MNVLDKINKEQLKKDLPDFKPGDTLRLHVLIVEGEGKDKKERVQIFTGTVIARDHADIAETITVRRVTNGYGVERVFPIHSPRIAKIEVVTRGKVRRAKLYYLRDRIGKAARIREELRTRPTKTEPSDDSNAE